MTQRIELQIRQVKETFDSSLDLEFVDYARHPLFVKPLPVQTLYAADESRDRMRVGDNNYFGQSEGHFGCRMKWLAPNRIRIWPGVKSDVFIGVNYENGRDTGVHPVESLVSGILLENNAFIQPRAQVLYIHGASDVFERGNRTILTK